MGDASLLPCWVGEPPRVITLTDGRRRKAGELDGELFELASFVGELLLLIGEERPRCWGGPPFGEV